MISYHGIDKFLQKMFFLQTAVFPFDVNSCRIHAMFYFTEGYRSNLPISIQTQISTLQTIDFSSMNCATIFLETMKIFFVKKYTIMSIVINMCIHYILRFIIE